MAIVLFILIAGLWAAFLLPSFFDQRSNAPKSTTKDFARTRQVLAAVSASNPDSDDYVRRHVQKRRTRVLDGLGVTALVTVFVATWTGSMPWLWATIAVDAVIAGYVTVLLSIKRQRVVPRASVVPIAAPAEPAAALAAVPEQPPFEESRTVRVIAG